MNEIIEFTIADKDILEETINLYDFKMPDNLRKEGWRLPNLEELRKMFLIGGNFKNDWYMTSETTSDFRNMSIHYGDKREMWRDVTESHWACCYIRLIKDK